MKRRRRTLNVLPLNKFLGIAAILLAFLFTLSCNKDDEADFNPDFSIEFITNNTVRYTNTSTGEYYSLTWNFGNDQVVTTTDKKETFDIYYPEAGDYGVSLRLTNFSGENKSVTKTVNIESSDFDISFTAEVDPDNPNMVNLENTTEGEYDSFKWMYRSVVVENEIQHQAYFPFSGTYNIDLVITKNNQEGTLTKEVFISQNDPNYEPGLVWWEEFDYEGLPNSAIWNMETGGDGWGNNELQYYTNSENNAYVDNGVLTITAREESFGGNDYTSARITTQNKFNVQYGRIEARIKLPYGQGLWPAFWMLGANFSSIGWPACGEIDIMEMVGGSGKDNTVHSTLHWSQNGQHAEFGQSYSLPSGIFADDYHIFAIQWTPQEIRAYVDDIEYFVIDTSPSGMSEFQNDFFIILNVAVGGNWPGPPNSATTFPQSMKVDYVRVYE